MKVDKVLSGAQDAISARRVFSEPYEKDGMTVIAVAAVGGGFGLGGGRGPGRQRGSGGGFGMGARPAGMYTIKDGKVSWHPAVDVNRLLAVLGAVAVALVLAGGRGKRRRAKINARHAPVGAVEPAAQPTAAPPLAEAPPPPPPRPHAHPQAPRPGG